MNYEQRVNMRTKWVLSVMALVSCLAWSQQQPAASPSKTPPQKIRVSSGVVRSLVVKKVLPDATDLKSIKNAEVKITFEVDPTGSVVSVMRKEGLPELQERCVKALQDWQFKPFVLNGQAIFVESYVYFHFNKGKVSVIFNR